MRGGAVEGAVLAGASASDGDIGKPAGRFVMDHAYWGPQFSDVERSAVLASRQGELDAQRCVVEQIADEGELRLRTTRVVADSKLIGWFQGRMEWGPRALGNRSILGDPRRADMKDIWNLKIKRRESFWPFAPSILREAVGDWFETDDDVPFMMQVYQIRAEKRAAIPAVTHFDGSGHQFVFEGLKALHGSITLWSMSDDHNEIRNGRHCVFMLHVHLVFVTKYCRGVFTIEILDDLRPILASVCADYESTLVAFDGED